MRCPFCISLWLCLLLGLASCTGPVLIEEGKSPATEAGEDVPPQRDSVPIIHEGSYASPYTIAEAQTLKHGKDVWVEGYIVGCVSGSMKSGCHYTAEATTASNILLADTFPTGSNYDYLYCFPIRLLDGSFERDDLNLYDNPGNYHRRVRIAGDITLYFSVPGIKDVFDYTFTDAPDESNNPDNPEYPDTPEYPDYPDNPDATRQDTLSIAEAITLQNKGEQPYIKGYIVGYYNGSSICFNPTEEQISTRARNNVVLADNIEETDCNNVIIVELPSKTALRSKVNLEDNPGNLHHRLTVKGMLREYKDDTGYHGCMETLSQYLDDEDYYFLLE